MRPPKQPCELGVVNHHSASDSVETGRLSHLPKAIHRAAPGSKPRSSHSSPVLSYGSSSVRSGAPPLYPVGTCPEHPVDGFPSCPVSASSYPGVLRQGWDLCPGRLIRSVSDLSWRILFPVLVSSGFQLPPVGINGPVLPSSQCCGELKTRCGQVPRTMDQDLML